MDRLVRALEKPVFGVVNKFDRRVGVIRVEMLERPGGHDHRGGDVVLHLHFGRGMKVFAQPKNAPGPVGLVAHAEKIGNQPAPVALQFIAGRAVDNVHAEMVAPMVAPGKFVEALDHKKQFQNILRNRPEPLVELVRVVVGGRGEQFHDRAKRTFGIENAPRVAARLGRVAEAVRVIARDQLRHQIEVLLEIRRENRAVKDGVGDGFGNFRFAAAGDGGRLVAQSWLGHGADQAPEAHGGRPLQLHAIAGGPDVNLAGQQFDRSPAPLRRPGDGLFAQIEVNVARHVDDVREKLVNRMAFRL